MSNTAIASAQMKRWVRGTTALLAACLAASTAAADSPSLAAPGDCAQPNRDFDSGPVLPNVSSGGVAGPPTAHFAPVAATQDVAARLPLDLTGITLQIVPATTSSSTSLLNTIGEALGLIDSTTVGALPTDGGQLVGEVGGAGGALLSGSGNAGATLLNSAGATGGTLAGSAGTAAGTLPGAGSLIQSTSPVINNTTGGLLK